MRDDVVFTEPIVDVRLEDLHFPPGDLCTAQPPNQLLALAAEHAAGDDLNPAGVRTVLTNIHWARGSRVNPESLIVNHRISNPCVLNRHRCLIPDSAIR